MINTVFKHVNVTFNVLRKKTTLRWLFDFEASLASFAAQPLAFGSAF